ncbi:hypothetical protein [Chryseobacterium sp. G0201]|uniref:hypothetical protein n=1 Tax=Chryseobacterium sp. G0201 TaxID=2487065 RepID=UPI000F4E3D57|nr:hypothetical protein [Chryseobacterium sp. G0201]AZA51554.1 hypothetical protein EG348_00310 [Chryseobacterium sp. G0201]
MKEIDLQVFTASFDKIEDLRNQDFILVSVSGKVIGEIEHKEEVEAFRGFSTYRMRYHKQAQDYLSCYTLYRQKLEKKGIEKILGQLEDLKLKHNKSKIVLLGYGNENEFDYRHIFAAFLQENSFNAPEYPDPIDMTIQRKLWQYDPYREAGHDNLTDEYVGETLEKVKFIFAKTIPDNPHHYTLRKDFGNDEKFLSIVRHIRFFGKLEEFGGMIFRCFYWKNHKYHTHPVDILDTDTDLINRHRIE